MQFPGYILVIDDETVIVETIADMLTDEGYRVVTALDGSTALNHIAQERPALVLLDRMMPRMSGDDVLRAIRSQGDGNLPVIVMSADTGARELLARGANAFLAKPFTFDTLLDSVARYMYQTP
ncbi:MAG: response regulator [Chloroflexaceae bacterium]|jgi:CheY-like chemotaxis protein|nr:response regulator [Chloroflexaceae bacterium]